MVPAPSRTTASILRVIPRERITRWVGRFTAAEVPKALLRPVLALYTRAYHVDLSEAVVPPEGFRSFNDFFTRRLRDGVHEIDHSPDVVVSPADGRLDDQGDIDAGSSFVVKGQTYDLKNLLGSAEEAVWFQGGRYAVVYLSPRDYHRVHSPVEGTVRRVRHLPGTLFPVNALGVANVPQLFARNERVVVHIDAPGLGRVAVVFVGAFVVGKISLTFDAPRRPQHGGSAVTRDYDPESAPRLLRGGDLGAFLLGSTVVLLLPPPAPGAWRWSSEAFQAPSPVRVGQPIARRSEE